MVRLLRSLYFVALFASVSPAIARALDVFVAPLVTDDDSIHPGQITDPALVNPWGVSYGPTTPFWVSDNGSGMATLYRVEPGTDSTSKQSLGVSIPGAGSVTGQVFNDGSQFNGDLFLFGSEDGTISGWRPSLGTNAEVLQTALPSNSYKGLTLESVSGNSYLFAADFEDAQIDVLKGSAGAPDLSGSFTDPNLPSGYAPFNIQNLGGTLYVTYAVVGPDGDDVAGAGNGIVNAFDAQGNLVRRIATGGVLDSPWGLAIAPTSFGDLAGKLLIGNFGDGTIHAFDPGSTDSLLGALTDGAGHPVSIDGLWALLPGNGAGAGDPDAIYFSAGPDEESHGLFGVIHAPEPGTGPLLAAGLAAIGFARRRRAV
jgi:uncharacterized protein (TIGR03118 family)